jgi:hypothetical protein
MDQERVCRLHPDKKALSFCHHCREYYCFECLKEGPEHYYCNNPKCQEALEQERNPPILEMTSSDSPETLPEDLTTIAAFTSPTEAEEAKAKLESEGIEGFIFDEFTGQGNFVIENVKLMVRETDAEKASGILVKPEKE